jgi:hypothetical protein
MLLWNAYRRNPLFLGLHETINRYTKSVLRKQHAFEQFFLFLKRTVHHDGQRLWPKSSPMVLPSPIRSVPLHHHTMGDAPYVRFRRNRRGGRVIGGVPPTPFRRFYALRKTSTDLAGRNRTWRCHPQCDRCRLIVTPWATLPTFGLVGIDGGGE